MFLFLILNNNNYNSNWLFDTTIHYSAHSCCSHATSHKADWILTDSFPALSCGERYIVTARICVPFFRGNETWTCSMYLLVCILFTLLVVCALTFISCWCWWFPCNKLATFACVVAGIFVYQARYSCWNSFSLLFLMLNVIRSFRFA